MQEVFPRSGGQRVVREGIPQGNAMITMQNHAEDNKKRETPRARGPAEDGTRPRPQNRDSCRNLEDSGKHKDAVTSHRCPMDATS